MAEYSRLMQGKVLSAGGQTVVIIPATPEHVEFINTTEITANDGGVTRVSWDIDMGQGAAAYVTTTSGADASLFTTTNGITTIEAALALQYGPVVLLGTSGGAGIAKTSSTVLTVTTAAAHGLVPGNWVSFQNLYQTSTTGMQQIAGIPFEVLTVGSTTTFTVGWVGNSANLTAITTAATGAAGFRQILYPALYVPGVAVPWAITTSNGVTTVTTTAPHNFQVGQQIAFRIPPVYGSIELNENQLNSTPGKQQTFYVASVASAVSFTFNGAPTYTAYTVAGTAFTSFPGMQFPEVVAVGDVNSGGFPFSGAQLYPSPTVYGGYSLVAQNTINGPAIQGAYIVNTWRGFIIGSTVAGATSDVIYWRAQVNDYSV
jgi:hypothetical protein